MMYDEEYDKKCDEIRKKNDTYLEEFCHDLSTEGLKKKTIDRHCQNIDVYINTYLLKEEPREMTCGTDPYEINNFLGNFFICKCMWSTPNAIKSTAASIKKFYRSMLNRGYINEAAYRELIETIKVDMEQWLADCEAYNDPESTDPFDFL